ncbi:MAG: rhomboid family intramembrane serine protease [bacterium]|nr:rhomboid family intramembrane serine protease [bacterium]
MFFLFPIGNDISVRRLPRITLAIIILNVLIFLLFSLPANVRLNNRSTELRHRMNDILMRYFNEECRQGKYEYSNNGLNKFVSDFENGEILDSDNPDYYSYLQMKYEYNALINRNINYKFGYIPARPTPITIISHMFLHGGFMHLLGNMWFLWLVGISLEDRWGRWYYLIFYLLSGIFAVTIYGFATAMKTIPLIGASGAIAGLMGAFMVRFYNSKIRYFWFFLLFIKPYWGIFEITSWFAMGLWFLNQVLQQTLFSGKSHVAFLAHIYGFIFGVGVALILKYTGIEDKFIKETVLKEKSKDKHNPLVAEAQDSVDNGNYREAIEKLEKAIVLNPDNIPARLKVMDLYEQYERDKFKSFEHFIKLLNVFIKKNDAVNFMLQFENYIDRFQNTALPERIQFFLGYAYSINNKHLQAIEEYKKFTQRYPQSHLVPKALLNAAKIYIYKTNEIQIGEKLLFVILKRYPNLEWKQNVEDEIKKIQSGKNQK